MLLQALISFSSGDAGREQDSGVDLVNRLTLQLADITSQCDTLAEDLVAIGDQITQITKMTEVHWASALAIALRKVNPNFLSDIDP